jgi:hypothetical protein
VEQQMNFPFTEVDYQGDDPTAPIIPTLGASGASAGGLNRSTKSKKSLIDNQTNLTSNKIRDRNQFSQPQRDTPLGATRLSEKLYSY